MNHPVYLFSIQYIYIKIFTRSFLIQCFNPDWKPRSIRRMIYTQEFYFENCDHFCERSSSNSKFQNFKINCFLFSSQQIDGSAMVFLSSFIAALFVHRLTMSTFKHCQMPFGLQIIAAFARAANDCTAPHPKPRTKSIEAPTKVFSLTEPTVDDVMKEQRLLHDVLPILTWSMILQWLKV